MKIAYVFSERGDSRRVVSGRCDEIRAYHNSRRRPPPRLRWRRAGEESTCSECAPRCTLQSRVSPLGSACLEGSMDAVETHKGDILVVDDNPVNLDLLSNMLLDRSYRVRVATSGRRALAAARSRPPDLV